MQNSIPLDTLSYVKILTSSGISREHAEAQAKAMTMMLTDYLASREDILAVNHRIGGVNHRIDDVITVTNARFDVLEAKINTRFGQIDGRFEQIDNRFKQIDEKINIKAEQLESSLTVRMGKMLAWYSGISIAIMSSVFTIISLVIH